MNDISASIHALNGKPYKQRQTEKKQISIKLILESIKSGKQYFSEIDTYLHQHGIHITYSCLQKHLFYLRKDGVLISEMSRFNGSKASKYSVVPFTSVEKDRFEDMQDNLLLMFGYTRHVPTGGRFIDNENFHVDYPVSKVKVYPGTSLGMEVVL